MPNVIEKDYSIRTDTVKKAIQKLQLKKSPGPDLINGLWCKKPSSFIPFVANFMANHLQIHKNRNDYVNYVYQLEESQSIRVGKEFIDNNNVVTTPTDTPKQAGKKLLR